MTGKLFRHAAVAFPLIAALAGCAKSPTGPEATKAVEEALRAESVLSSKTVYQFPDGTPITTIFDDASQIVIAKKVGNASEPNCGLFDIMTQRPTQYNGIGGIFSHGSTSVSRGVKICVPDQ